MARYLIHAIPERMWYVNDFLIQSMVNQGIARENIEVYCDNDKEGNLKAFRKSVENTECDYWHLQDDVLISTKFKAITEKHDKGIVCGFCSCYSNTMPIGKVDAQYMWYSFPCIRIPKEIMDEFLSWLDGEALTIPTYARWINAGKYDDSLFMEFVRTKHSKMQILNLKPNIVEHVDYLIGGSIVNAQRTSRKACSIYWEEPKAVSQLEAQLMQKGDWVCMNAFTAVKRL